MEWLGFLTVITAYWCFFLAAVTKRWGWALLTGWLVPVFAMTINYQSGMEINGLMVLICVVMFLLCRKGLTDVKMWNVKVRKKHNIIFGLLYLLVFLLLFYSLVQAQMQGYLLNLQGWGSSRLSVWRVGLPLIPLLALNVVYTRMVYTVIDRLHCKKEQVTLLACRTYIANEAGVEKGLNQGYFFEGIQNGVTYYFRMTRRTFYMIRKETKLRLEVCTGILGGRYVVDLGQPDWLKRTRRRDRQDAKLGMILFVLLSAAAIWYYWFFR